MSNPHNPSGKQFDTAFLTAIADKMKALNGYFVIDEAYLDYGTAYDMVLAPHLKNAYIIKGVWNCRLKIRCLN